jgi:hypothetical protein
LALNSIPCTFGIENTSYQHKFDPIVQPLKKA